MINYPLTSETMYGATPNGGTTICNACGVPVGYDGLVPLVLCYHCSQTESTSKVEKLAANLKHLDKPALYSSTPHRLAGSDVAFATGWGNALFHFKKVGDGRNKSGTKVTRGTRHQVLEALDSLIYDTRPSRFFEGETVRTPRQSQAIRDGYWHWFPVALENTAYSDAIARHFTWMGQEGLRVTPGFVFGHRLSSKYDGRRYFDKEWAPNELWGNKAQVNRYFACKTY